MNSAKSPLARSSRRLPAKSTKTPRRQRPTSSPPLRTDEELSELIATLDRTERRLNELTAGEVDTVAGRDGRTFLLRHAQDRMREREATKQAAILNALPAHIALLDTQGIIVSVNDAWQRFSGTSAVQRPGYAVGLNYLAICDSAPVDDVSEAHRVAAGIRSVLNGEIKTFSIEYPCHSAAQQRWLLMTVTPLAQDRPDGVVVVHLNVTEEKQAKEALRELALLTTHSAEHDFLTGLPNRTLLNDRVNQAISLAKRHRAKVAMLFLDLDGFKHINDSLGHSTGDKLLQSIAIRLVDCVRASDTISRQGGDEFVALLSEAQQAEDAAISARRMLAAVAQTHSIDGHDLHITTSIGISVYPGDGLETKALIKNADTAMYHAKENGRQNYRFFKAAMNVRAAERQFIEDGLRHALARQEFALCYQPKIDLRTGAIVGAEALLRWTHPTRGPIAPAQFISVAEDCGLILPIGFWVLREACEQARTWAHAKLPVFTVAVNVSAMQFHDENFVAAVFAIPNDTGVDPNALELELTESVLMKRAELTAASLHILRERGVRMVIDDFCTGYSSLSHLQQFPIDALKIDESFVRQIGLAPTKMSIVNAVIGMGRSLGLRVIAEGVETRAELAFLCAHRCDEAQGRYISRPLPAPQFAQLLRSGLPRRDRLTC